MPANHEKNEKTDRRRERREAAMQVKVIRTFADGSRAGVRDHEGKGEVYRQRKAGELWGKLSEHATVLEAKKAIEKMPEPAA